MRIKPFWTMSWVYSLSALTLLATRPFPAMLTWLSPSLEDELFLGRRLSCLKLPVRSMASSMLQTLINAGSICGLPWPMSTSQKQSQSKSHFCPSHHTSFPCFSTVCFHTVETLPSNIPLFCLVSFYRPSLNS